jgi:hypothetical protein
LLVPAPAHALALFKGEKMAPKLSHGSRSEKRNLAHLAPILDKRILSYATAATAAGIGLLIQPAEARIVYTPADVSIPTTGNVIVDLNHDGVADFALYRFFDGEGNRHPEGVSTSGLAIGAYHANQIRSVQSRGIGCAAALPNGAKIGPGQPFGGNVDLVLAQGSYNKARTEHCKFGYEHHGAFLGFKFTISGQTHYGWAHVTVSGNGSVLNGYAYETVANQPILAGKTSEPVAETQASLLLVPEQQPASLGLLARGADGLAIWRRSEEAAVI